MTDSAEKPCDEHARKAVERFAFHVHMTEIQKDFLEALFVEAWANGRFEAISETCTRMKL